MSNFPYTAEFNFEGGSSGMDAEVDTQSRLAVEHVTTLVGKGLVPPFRGAYAAHADLSVGTNDAYFQENTSFDIAADASLYIGMNVYVTGTTLGTNDRFTILALQNGTTDEIVLDIRDLSGTLQVLASETNTCTTVAAVDLTEDKWHHFALNITLDDVTNQDGTIDFFVDGVQAGSQITCLAQNVITTGLLGVFNQDTNTTAGHVIISDVIVDDAQLYPENQFPQTIVLTASGHVALGPGQVEEVYLLDGGSGDTIAQFFDTNAADTNQNEFMGRLDYASGGISNRIGDGWLSLGQFTKGCYVSLSGTNPILYISFRHKNSSQGAIANWAAKAKKPL